MGDRARASTTSQDFYNVLGISKSATIKEMCKAYKSLVKKWHPDRNPSNNTEAQLKFQQINEAYKILNENKINESPESIDYAPTTSPSPSSDFPTKEGSHHRKKSSMDGSHRRQKSSMDGSHHRQKSSMDESFFSGPSVPSRNVSKKSRSRSPGPTFFSRSESRRSISPTPDTSRSRSKSTGRRCVSETEIPSLAKTATPKFSSLGKTATLKVSNPIVYSHSTVRRKPPPTERKIECSLEELCHGSIKKIKITRNVLKNGLIDEDEEILKIRVKPGWTKGTKITFEGKGDEKPGFHPADLILVIDEKRHPLFKREGDDLEYGVTVPLVKALTGCSISVPLLGGEKMCLSFDDIIYPGFEKVIRGQGMPTKEEGKRGDLRIKFFVEFPDNLSDEERDQALCILQDCNYLDDCNYS